LSSDSPPLSVLLVKEMSTVPPVPPGGSRSVLENTTSVDR
jgi:hypothetical protein